MNKDEMLEKKPSIKKNFIYNLSFQILTIIVPVITTPYLARTLHPVGNGIYSYTHTIALFFSLFAALGINSYGQREVAYHQNERKARSEVFWELWISRVLCVAITLVAYAFFIFFSTEYKVEFIFQATIILSIAFDISWLFTGLEQYRITTIRNAIIKIITVVLIFATIRSEGDLIKYILIMGGSQIASGLYMFAYLPRYVDHVQFKELSFKKHIRGTIEFFLPVLAVQLYSQIDKVMLGRLCDISENGYYEQARKISNLAVSAIVSINTVLYSRISFLFAQKKIEQIKELYKKSISILLLFLAPVVIGLFVISDSFTVWFFGPEYYSVGGLLRMSCPLIVFMCLGNFVGVQYLNPTKQQNKATIIYLIAAIINIILNAIIIPRYGAYGALIASNIAEFTSFFLQLLLMLRSDYRFSPPYKTLFKCMVSAGLMGAVVYAIDRLCGISGMPLTIIEIITGGVVYLLILIVLKEDETKAILNGAMRRLHRR